MRREKAIEILTNKSKIGTPEHDALIKKLTSNLNPIVGKRERQQMLEQKIADRLVLYGFKKDEGRPRTGAHVAVRRVISVRIMGGAGIGFDMTEATYKNCLKILDQILPPKIDQFFEAGWQFGCDD